MIPRIIHFTVPKTQTPSQAASIKRARELHPDWTIKVWQDPVDSAGFRLAHYHGKANSGAQLADLIRLDVIYRFGGIYLDSDVDVLRPLDPLLQADHFFCSEDGAQLTNAVFACTEHSRYLERIIAELEENEPDWELPPNLTTGPDLFARVLQWAPGLNLLPRETFYPYNWNEAPVEPPHTTFAVHRWAASWVKDRHVNPPEQRPTPRTKLWVKEVVRRNLAKIESRIAESVSRRLPPPPRAFPTGMDLVARTTRGIWMSLPGSDLSITPEIALLGTYEEVELKFVERVLRGGDFFVDVGCNVGVFALVAAKCVKPFGRVIAFDPNPSLIRHLKRSALMNWTHDRLKVHEIAVGAEEGRATLHFAAERLGDANLGLDDASVFHRSNDMTEGEHRLDVEQRSLDSVIPDAIEIKILKIDVEGFEHAVLAGSKRMLQSRQPKYILMELLAEVSSTRHAQNVAAVRYTMDCGYDICSISQTGDLTAPMPLEAALRRSRNIVLTRR